MCLYVSVITTHRESCRRASSYMFMYSYVCITNIRKGAAHAVITYVCVSNTQTESCGRASCSYNMCVCNSNIYNV